MVGGVIQYASEYATGRWRGLMDGNGCGRGGLDINARRLGLADVAHKYDRRCELLLFRINIVVFMHRERERGRE
jgi:hypothetical protein